MERIRHIDGLRAVAIIPVVFYHAFPNTFPNGFLGVDYFLVISGFVISKKYFVEPNEKFSLGKFWSKRISRLYPQLLTCLTICLPIAWLTMHSDHLENFSQSSIASLLGVNNILLYLTGGYWNFSNEFKPLFTTWSLGLEEQFYLLIAILFAIMQNNQKSYEFIKKIFFILFISSLISSGFGAIYFQKANYLLLPNRFWEFSIGIYSAFLLNKKISWLTNSVTNFSFVLIITSLLIPIETSNYAPNPLLLIPLISLALICISNNSSATTYILSSKVFVYIGISSYSIYLYHQPILAFARLTQFDGLKTSTLLILVIVSFLVGFLMYEIIERRLVFYLLRSPNFFLLKPKILLMISVIICFINIPIIVKQGFFELRFPYLLENGKPPLGFLGGKGYTDHPFIYLDKKFPINKKNLMNDKNLNRKKIFLLGDSITRDLINSLEIIDSANPALSFDYSYKLKIKKSEYTKNTLLIEEDIRKLLDQADIIIVQVNNNGIKDLVIDQEISKMYAEYSQKLIWYKSRERFVNNITPVVFKTKLKERKSFMVKSGDSYSCNEEDVISNKFKPENSGLAVIDSQCAFNDQNGMKLLTSENGQIYSFDGIHLTYEGAAHLASVLRKSNLIKFLN